MIVRKQDRRLEHDDPNVKIYDYPLPGVGFGISYQEYSEGRHPKKGAWKNTVCEEAYFILDGGAIVYLDGNANQVSEGDIIVIPVKHTVYLETTGVKLLTITNPDWFAEQHEILD
jgi:mannose-6-phosphate isomerase-like protein (cupin superfamily)